MDCAPEVVPKTGFLMEFPLCSRKTADIIPVKQFDQSPFLNVSHWLIRCDAADTRK